MSLAWGLASGREFTLLQTILTTVTRGNGDFVLLRAFNRRCLEWVFIIIIIIIIICLLQLGWRPVAAVTYMYTNINYGSNVLETSGTT